MVLSDKTIKEEIKNKNIIIDPLGENAIQPASVDVRLDENILVEVKLQNTGGTAENKLAYEMWTLQYACDHSNLYEKAYIIYGGTGFTRSVLTNLHEMVKMYSKVELIEYENDKTLSIIRNEI